jgi:hypothetical protein
LPFFNTLKEHDKYLNFIVRSAGIILVLWFAPSQPPPAVIAAADPVIRA